MHSLIKFIMYKNLQVHPDSTSSSDAQNIQSTAPKHRKFLLGVAYRKMHLVDENGQPLHPANYNNIASSSYNPETMMVIIIIIFWYIYWLICNYFNVKLIYNHAILSTWLPIDIICFVLIMFNFFFFLIIRILVMMNDLPTIFHCTPRQCQIERRLN